MANIKTGRHYKPASVISPLGVVGIIKPYIMKYFRKPENVFDPQNTAMKFFDVNMDKCEVQHFDFKHIRNRIKQEGWIADIRLLSKIVFWGYWYNNITKAVRL